MEHVYLLQKNQVQAKEKRERGKEFPIRLDRLLLQDSINNTLISRKVPSESEKNTTSIQRPLHGLNLGPLTSFSAFLRLLLEH